MKQEDAIKKLEYMKICYEEEIGQCSGLSDAEWIEHVDMCNVAIQALEKQVPKKPNIKELPDAFGRLYWNACGACDEEIESDYTYCPECGQKIDWEETP